MLQLTQNEGTFLLSTARVGQGVNAQEQDKPAPSEHLLGAGRTSQRLLPAGASSLSRQPLPHHFQTVHLTKV